MQRQRVWLKRHGKTGCIDFDENERKALKKYFHTLDADNSGMLPHPFPLAASMC